MSLNPRLIALQGVGYSPQQTAVQGLLNDFVEAIETARGGYVLGEHAATRKRDAWDDAPTLDQIRLKQRIIEEDRLASEFILALMTTGFLNA